MCALCGFWWLLGFSPSDKKAFTAPEEDDRTSPVRQCLAGHKRRATRILLAILSRRLQSALGYPVCTSIGRSLSPGMYKLVSPTKPCGKGNKRRHADIDEEEHQTWVEALTQELVEDEDPSVDPDYEDTEMGVGMSLQRAPVPSPSPVPMPLQGARL
ncbi:unnamed protein product [Coregonus sp. 'balchen']|nr:unnamed protein product [Coregonus sp. 'balchen']